MGQSAARWSVHVSGDEVRVDVSNDKQDLVCQETRRPDARAAAVDRQHPRRHYRLHLEEKKRTQKRGDEIPGHARPAPPHSGDSGARRRAGRRSDEETPSLHRTRTSARNGDDDLASRPNQNTRKSAKRLMGIEPT